MSTACTAAFLLLVASHSNSIVSGIRNCPDCKISKYSSISNLDFFDRQRLWGWLHMYILPQSLECVDSKSIFVFQFCWFAHENIGPKRSDAIFRIFYFVQNFWNMKHLRTKIVSIESFRSKECFLQISSFIPTLCLEKQSRPRFWSRTPSSTIELFFLDVGCSEI